MKFGWLVAFLAAVSFAPANASFPDQSSVKEYFDRAEIVAYVRIESGSIDRINGDICGVNYQADVLRKFKGDTGRLISFSGGPSASGVEVGKNYLVFISTQRGNDRRKSVQYYGMPDEFLDRCKTEETFLLPFILIGEQFNGSTLSFIVPERIVAFPASVKSQSGVSVIGSDVVLEPKYVGQEDAFSYLESLSTGR